MTRSLLIRPYDWKGVQTNRRGGTKGRGEIPFVRGLTDLGFSTGARKSQSRALLHPGSHYGRAHVIWSCRGASALSSAPQWRCSPSGAASPPAAVQKVPAPRCDTSLECPRPSPLLG